MSTQPESSPGHSGVLRGLFSVPLLGEEERAQSPSDLPGLTELGGAVPERSAPLLPCCSREFHPLVIICLCAFMSRNLGSGEVAYPHVPSTSL